MSLAISSRTCLLRLPHAAPNKTERNKGRMAQSSIQINMRLMRQPSHYFRSPELCVHRVPPYRTRGGTRVGRQHDALDLLTPALHSLSALAAASHAIHLSLIAVSFSRRHSLLICHLRLLQLRYPFAAAAHCAFRRRRFCVAVLCSS